MNVKSIVLSGIGAIGLLGSCKSNDIGYKAALQKQYEVINNNKNIVEQYGYSTLKPNGRLSSIEGNDILSFLTKEDSIAYDEMNKLGNGIVKKVQTECQNDMRDITDNYLRSKNAANAYYKNTKFNANNYFEYKNSIEDIEKNKNILSKSLRKSYVNELENAHKQKAKILKNARKTLNVFVRKNAIK